MQHSLSLKYLLVTAMLFSGCMDNFSKGTVRDRSSKIASISTTVDASGNYSAEMDSNSTVTQTVRVASGALAGSALSMPPGALAFPVSVTIGEGSSLTTSSTSAQIGLSGNSAKSAGPAISFIPSTSIQASSPFTLSIPVSSSTGLLLDGATVNDDNLVVIYKWVTVVNGESSYSVGILPRSELLIAGKSVQFQTTKFGTFQVAVTEIKITEKIEKQTVVPPVLRSAIFTPLAVTYSGTNEIYRVGVAIATNSVTYTGGAPDEFSVTPSLPAGLSISSSTGAITGTPTAIAASTSYTVTGKNEAGSVESKLTIRVASAAIPTVTLSSTVASTSSDLSFSVTATFSEAVTGFDATDLTVGNAAVSGFTGSGTTYTFTLAPTVAGSVTVDIAAGAGSNDSGMATAAATRFSHNHTVAFPSVTISTPAGSLTNAAFPVIVIFSEAVTGFTVADITSTFPSTGSVSAFTGSGTTYNFMVTAYTSGNVVIGVPADVAVSSTNQGNTAATSLTVAFDNSQPTVVSVGSTTANGIYKAGDVISIQVNFSEAVGVAGVPELILNAGGAPAYYSTGTGTSTLTFTYTVAAGSNSGDLDYIAGAALSGAIADFATNPAVYTLPTSGGPSSLSNAKNIVIDTTSPFVSSLTLSGSSTSSNSTQVWAVVFSELVTGFTNAGLTINGSTNSITVTPSGTAPTATWNVTVTLPPNTDQPNLFPTFVAGAAVDLAQNNSLAYSSGSPQAVSYYVPVTISAVTSPTPDKPGLTRRPTLHFTIDRPADSFKVYGMSDCTGNSMDLGALGTGTISIALNTDLPISGVQPMWGQATTHTSILSTCVSMGSYTTGVNRVMVASDTSLSADWACSIVNGGLKCWGSNSQGQLGVATPSFSSTPIEVFASNSSVSGVAMSLDWNSQSPIGASTCAVVNQGVKCWGKNTFGQLGNNTTGNSSVPVTVLDNSLAALSNVASLYGSTGRFCALKINGDLFCWGRNSYGAVGVNVVEGTSNNIPKATKVTGSDLYTNVSMGNYYTCGVTTTGAVKCWGFDEWGQLGGSGAGTTPVNKELPTQVVGIDGTAGNIATQVSASGGTTCAVVSGGARCWGKGNNGQRGDNTTTSAVSTPVTVGVAGVSVGILTNVYEVLAGESSYALFNGNTSFNSWGSNIYNAIFQTSNVTSYYAVPTVPTAAPMSSSYTVSGAGYSMAGGSMDVVCFMVNGGVVCRGQTAVSGSMGIGSETGYALAASSNVTSVSASKNFSCAVIDNSSIQCWGKNTSTVGQLGRGPAFSATLDYVPANVINIP